MASQARKPMSCWVAENRRHDRHLGVLWSALDGLCASRDTEFFAAVRGAILAV